MFASSATSLRGSVFVTDMSIGGTMSRTLLITHSLECRLRAKQTHLCMTRQGTSPRYFWKAKAIDNCSECSSLQSSLSSKCTNASCTTSYEVHAQSTVRLPRNTCGSGTECTANQMCSADLPLQCSGGGTTAG